ncbi:MAG: T9SS type A sorting domain-containing protein [Candidatus Latescibacterota bacterium]
MKKSVAMLVVLMLFAVPAFAANFSPTMMKVTAPSNIIYDFDGKNLTIPVTVSGVGGVGSFLVFTKDKGTSIGEVTNGYLGWHHVNKIDTCLYTSSFVALPKGTSNITWNGKDENGATIPAGEYTYYIWAVDNVNPRVQVTKQVNFAPWSFRTILTTETNGNPLNQPIWHGGGNTANKTANPVNQTFFRWVIGGDPEDAALKETTVAKGFHGVGGIAFDPADRKYFFYTTQKEGAQKITEKWEWVPNGVAVLQTSWGEDGQSIITINGSTGWYHGPGIVSDGKDYLFTVDGDMSNINTESKLIYLDVKDGSEIKRLDLAEWWVDSNEGKTEVGGQYGSGPTEICLRHNLMALGSHSTCVNQLIDPYYEDEKDAVKWTNTNGDYTGDHNFDPTAVRKWVCNDYNVGPYKYNVSLDNNLFMAFPSYDMGAVSFGLYAPDGTGMGYTALAGETAFQKSGVEFIDYDSAYDGLYTTSNVGRTTKGVDTTIWYVGHDSIKGVISNQIGVKEKAPAAFSVAQNTPNPFNPATTISFTLAKAGKTTVEVHNAMGQKVDTILNANLSAGSHSVTWNSVRNSAGVYFYTVRSGSFSRTMKMTLLK